jgi:hypothetical protein
MVNGSTADLPNYTPSYSSIYYIKSYLEQEPSAARIYFDYPV